MGGPLTGDDRQSRGKVLLITNDGLLSRGAASYLSEHLVPVDCVEPEHLEDGASLALGCSLLIVDIRYRIGSDFLAGCDVLGVLSETAAPSTLIAAFGCGAPAPLALLRVAEAGAQFYLDLLQLPGNPAWLVELAEGEDAIPRLPTRWELREQMGLRWDGDLAPLVAALAELPENVWEARPKLRTLDVSRRQIEGLRRLASEAGIPSPDPLKYSTAYRSAPRHPEWSTLWSVGCDLLGHGTVRV